MAATREQIVNTLLAKIAKYSEHVPAVHAYLFKDLGFRTLSGGDYKKQLQLKSPANKNSKTGGHVNVGVYSCQDSDGEMMLLSEDFLIALFFRAA